MVVDAAEDDGRYKGPFPGQQTKFFQRTERWVLYGGAGGGGKAQEIQALIPTPDGWTRMGDINVGDEVFSADGHPVRVVGATEIMYGHDCYRLGFSDGTSLVVDAEHLWVTLTYRERVALLRRSDEFTARRRASRKARGTGKRPDLAARNAAARRAALPFPMPSIRTTRQIAESLRDGKNINHSVEPHAPLDPPSADLQVPPYTMGAWLGDGTSIGGEIAGVDSEVFDNVARDGFSIRPRSSPYLKGVEGLRQCLMRAGVFGKKHIPMCYLRASLAQRLALAQGLMDTDGWCEKDGSCKIALTNERLFNDVVELLRTLGIVVNVTSGMKTATNGAPGNATMAWTACFVTPLPMFRLTRKAERQNRTPHPRYLRRYITSAERVASVPVRCIKVDREDGLYVTGEQFITTHNTVCLIGKFTQQLYTEAKRFERGEIQRSRAWGIYLRRNTTDLKQAIDIAHWIFLDLGLCTGDDYNINDHIFTFPACGNARFQFGHMEHERSKYKYKSNAYTYIAPDEVTEFTETQIEYIDTRLRTTDKVLEPMMQICCGSNPDGVGLLWVRNKFIEGKVPETVYRNETVTSSGKVINFDQIFIPAKLRDNPVLYESGVYEAALMNKRPEVREAILEGNWYISAGSFLGEVWDTAYHVCDDHDIPRGVTIARSGDFGTRSPSSITWWYIDRDGAFTAFHNLYVKGLVAERVADKIKEVEQFYGLWDDDADCSTLTGPLDEDCFNKANTSGPSIAEAFKRKGVRWRRSNKNRLMGAAQLISRLVARIPGAVEGEPARPMIRWMKRCVAPIRTLPILMPDENDPNVPDTRGDDHCYDETTYMCLWRPLLPSSEAEEDDDAPVVDIKSRRRYSAGGRLGEPPGGW